MVPLGKGLKRAPKWAWATAAGVGIGAVAIHTFRNRAADPSTATTAEDGSSPATTPTGSATGILMPPVIVSPPTTDPNEGVGPLQELYIGSMRDVLDSWEALVGPLMGTVNTLALDARPSTLAAIAAAGAAPTSQPSTTPEGPAPVVSTAPAPTLTAAPPPPAPSSPGRCPANYPLGTPPDCYQFAWNYETRQSGTNKWCVKMERHMYQSGRDVTLTGTAVKVHDGKC